MTEKSEILTIAGGDTTTHPAYCPENPSHMAPRGLHGAQTNSIIYTVVRQNTTYSTLFAAGAMLAASLAFSGCFALQRGKIMTTGQEHVLVSNYGWYLFHCIPIACGNASHNPWSPWISLRDDVTMDCVQERFMNYANGQNADVSDLDYTITDSIMFNIPGIELPMPIPYLLTYREIQLSGVLTPRPTPPKTPDFLIRPEKAPVKEAVQ